MAKKLSKFGSAFDKARKSGASEFDFGGKKYNTKLKEGGSKKSSLPASTSVLPKSRADAVTAKAKGPSFSGLSNVAKEGAKPTSSKKMSKLATRTPQEKETAMSKAYITNKTATGGAFRKQLAGMNGKKPVQGPNMTTGDKFKAAMKKVSNSIKMGSKGK